MASSRQRQGKGGCVFNIHLNVAFTSYKTFVTMIVKYLLNRSDTFEAITFISCLLLSEIF